MNSRNSSHKLLSFALLPPLAPYRRRQARAALTDAGDDFARAVQTVRFYARQCAASAAETAALRRQIVALQDALAQAEQGLGSVRRLRETVADLTKVR